MPEGAATAPLYRLRSGDEKCGRAPMPVSSQKVAQMGASGLRVSAKG